MSTGCRTTAGVEQLDHGRVEVPQPRPRVAGWEVDGDPDVLVQPLVHNLDHRHAGLEAPSRRVRDRTPATIPSRDQAQDRGDPR